MPAFPSYEGARFTEQEIETFLLDLSQRGWHVFSDGGKGYYVELSPATRIKLDRSGPDWIVQGELHGNPVYHEKAVDFTLFKRLVSEAASSLGADLEVAPSTMRLVEDQPATNKVSLVSLAHGATVTAIFDPYFEDRSIATLCTLHNLGLRLAPTVQVLMTSKTRQRLSQNLRDDFGKERGIQLDIRICAAGQEHRRFLLLSSGQSLIIGCSLNCIDKNEAAHVEPSGEDETFFYQQWASATAA